MAETFHRLGAQVLVVARGQAGLDAIARDLPGIAYLLASDASAADAPERVFAVKPPHILILCGGAVPVYKPASTNLTGTHSAAAGTTKCA